METGAGLDSNGNGREACLVAVCFCGCGRTVRRSKKKLSARGAEAVATVVALERFSKPLADAGESDRDEVHALIEHGREICEMYAGVIHGERPAPPWEDQRRIMYWEKVAPRRVAADAGRIRAFEAGNAKLKASSPESAAIDAVLGPIDPAEGIANLRRLRDSRPPSE